MKKQATLLTALLLGGFVAEGLGQSFDSGSSGALGALDVTANTTVDLPPDGKLHYTTVNVRPNMRLTFNRNANNTPVYVLAQGDIVVEGTIDVSGAPGPNNVPIGGKGGPGGFDGGMPGFGADIPPGDGYGPGGGKAGELHNDQNNPGNVGSGSYATRVGVAGGATYGSPLLIPLIGGSGAGGSPGQPGSGGAGGGGAILLASNTRIFVPGRIDAMGGNTHAVRCCHYTGSGGSGGAIRLLAPRVDGGGTVNVQGQTGGGDGRIRIDTIDRSDLRLVFQPTASTTVGANLFVFPSTIPRLDVTEAAGTTIPLESGPVKITLPFGSSTNRTVTVRAAGFGTSIPIALVLTPESGRRVLIESQIDNTTQNPATVTIPVQLLPNVQTTIHAWTR